jgi:hypothetical protein
MGTIQGTLCLIVLLAMATSSMARGFAAKQVSPGVLQTGVMTDPDITESSGLIASRKFPGIFWTHNDHGSKPTLFAVTRNGSAVAKFDVMGATISDWEDISVDDSGNLYIGDIGNNDLNRDEAQIYRVPEPSPRGSGSVRVAQTWRIKFPDGPQNAETFFISNGFGYIVSKYRNNGAVGMYRFPFSSKARVTTLQKLGSIKVNSDVGGGALSPDGNRLALVTDIGAYLFRVNGNPATATKTRGSFTQLIHSNLEGASFVNEGLAVSAENGDVFLFNGRQFQP